MSEPRESTAAAAAIHEDQQPPALIVVSNPDAAVAGECDDGFCAL